MRPSSAVALIAILAALGTPAHAQQRWRQLIELRRASQAQATPPTGTRIERDIAYGTHPAQRYDVYLPANAGHGSPILVMVHGGGWHRGDKAGPSVAGEKARYWLEKGFVFVSVNYRLVPDADPVQQARDVASAVASVQARAARWRADPNRVVLMGHSAGAHLVALLAAAPSMLAQAGATRVRGAVVLDSAALDVPETMRQPFPPDIYRDAFGTDSRFWLAASPYQQLTRDSLPMLLVCSSRRQDSCPQGHALAERARSLGVAVEVLPEALRHGEVSAELGKPSAYTRAVSAWIDRLLD